MGTIVPMSASALSSTLDTLWFTRCPVPTATGIAADRGWFTDEFAPDGIQVRSLQDAGTGRSPEDHFTHALTGLFREGGNVPALWTRGNGEPTRLIGLTWIEERQAILVRRDSAIATPAQLAGARIAIPHRPIAIDFWRAMALAGFAGALGAAGLALGDVVPVEVQAAPHAPQWVAELEALTAGRVDAVYVKGALAVETAARYDAVIGIDLDAFPDRTVRINNGTPRPVTVHQRLLDEHPEIVVRFLAVLIEAAEWAAANPADVARILAAETGAGATGVAGAYAWTGSADLRLDLSEDRLGLLARQEKFLREHGFLARPVDIAAWTAAEPLAAAHTLVRARATER
ncbi:ABC transporter substrate-binding protein [Nocardia sp. JMUB6875]